MKPERSELVVIEEQERKSEKGAFTPAVRQLLGNLLERAFIKLVSFLNRRWAPKTGGHVEGGEDTDD